MDTHPLMPATQSEGGSLTGVACAPVQDVLDEASLPPRAEVGLPDERIIYSCSNQVRITFCHAMHSRVSSRTCVLLLCGRHSSVVASSVLHVEGPESYTTVIAVRPGQGRSRAIFLSLSHTAGHVSGNTRLSQPSLPTQQRMRRRAILHAAIHVS